MSKVRKRKKKKQYRIKWGKIFFTIFLINALLILGYAKVIWPIFIHKPRIIEAQLPDEVYGVSVVTKLIPENRPSRPGIKREIKYVVIHETGNYEYGTTAAAHSTYLNNTSKENSWHYTVDDNEIYHHLPDDEVGWHAGDGLADPGGNLNGIGIEICVNEDGDFDQALDNTARLVAYLLISYDLTIDDVKQHHDFNGKNCPETIREEGIWKDFLKLINQYYQDNKPAEETWIDSLFPSKTN